MLYNFRYPINSIEKISGISREVTTEGGCYTISDIQRAVFHGYVLLYREQMFGVFKECAFNERIIKNIDLHYINSGRISSLAGYSRINGEVNLH